jgi:imidazolonepropionase-like amidohydrolase
MSSRKLALLLLVVCASRLSAQAPTAERVIVLRPARMIDTERGQIIERPVIVVRGDRIVAAAPGATVPAGAETIDLPDVTLLPGFLDMHTHLTSDPSGGYADKALHQWPGYAAIVGVKNARKTLMAGFTTVRNVGGDEFADIALRDAINAGLVPGPRVFTAAHSLGITGGHCDTNGFRPDLLQEPGPDRGISNGTDEVMKAVRYQIKYGADVIKICATGGVLSAGDAVGVQQYTFDEIKSIVETAAHAERKVAAHAHGLEGIKVATRAGVASIEHGSMLDDEAIRLMKEHGTYLVPTRMAFEAVVKGAREGKLAPWSAKKALDIAPHASQSFAKAVAGGVKIAFGTDAGVFPHGENAGEFRLMVEAGMTPIQAIQAATVGAADLLGAPGKELGVIAAGRFADLVGVRGNPVTDIRVLEKADFVMKAGVVYKRGGREQIEEVSVARPNT